MASTEVLDTAITSPAAAAVGNAASTRLRRVAGVAGGRVVQGGSDATSFEAARG